MSTRCQVLVTGPFPDQEQVLYHHHDGYPSYMVPRLKEVEIHLSDNAHTMSRKNSVPAITNRIIATSPDEYQMEGTRKQLRQGGMSWMHGDIEYLYHVTVTHKTLSLAVYTNLREESEIDDLTPVWAGPLELADDAFIDHCVNYYAERLDKAE